MMRKAEPRHSKIGPHTDHPIASYQPIADLLSKTPYFWLAEFFRDWSQVIHMTRVDEDRRPTRKAMVETLKGVHDTAGHLLNGIGRILTSNSLKIADGDPRKLLTLLHMLQELQRTAKTAASSPDLVDSHGRPKPGRGRVKPQGAISAMAYCALFIAGAWKFFHGHYPAPRNRKAANAIHLYWELIFGEKRGWGDNPWEAWRHHFKEGAKAPYEQYQVLIQDYLREAESAWRRDQARKK